MLFELESPDTHPADRRPSDPRPGDRRSVRFERDPAAIDAAWDAGHAWKEAELAFAKALAVIEEKRAYREFGCASLSQWAQRLGIAAEETRRLLAIGQAIAAQPSIEERVRERALTASAAAAVAPILVEDSKARGGPLPFSEWTNRAQHSGLMRLRRAVREERARRRSGESIVRVELHVTETVREDLERARVVASRKESRFVTRDETVGIALDHYLTAFDPLRETEGTRRVGPTADRPEDRYIPVSVRRAVRRRAGDCCEVPGCEERINLEFAHRTPHCEGSGREESDLFLLCWLHHAMVDQGLLRVVGSMDDPSWIDAWGDVLTKSSPGGREPRSKAEWVVSREQSAKRGWGSDWPEPPDEPEHTAEKDAAEGEATTESSLVAALLGRVSGSAVTTARGDASPTGTTARPRAPP